MAQAQPAAVDERHEASEERAPQRLEHAVPDVEIDLQRLYEKAW